MCPDLKVRQLSLRNGLISHFNGKLYPIRNCRLLNVMISFSGYEKSGTPYRLCSFEINFDSFDWTKKGIKAVTLCESLGIVIDSRALSGSWFFAKKPT